MIEAREEEEEDSFHDVPAGRPDDLPSQNGSDVGVPRVSDVVGRMSTPIGAPCQRFPFDEPPQPVIEDVSLRPKRPLQEVSPPLPSTASRNERLAPMGQASLVLPAPRDSGLSAMPAAALPQRAASGTTMRASAVEVAESGRRDEWIHFPYHDWSCLHILLGRKRCTSMTG